MGYKTKRFGATKVDLGDGYWAEVAPLTKAEDDECQRALLGGELEGSVGDAQALRARFHQREYTDQMLLFAIRRWNLDDDDGSILPVDLPHIQGLADADSDKLLAEIRRRNNPVAALDGPARSD